MLVPRVECPAASRRWTPEFLASVIMYVRKPRQLPGSCARGYVGCSDRGIIRLWQCLFALGAARFTLGCDPDRRVGHGRAVNRAAMAVLLCEQFTQHGCYKRKRALQRGAFYLAAILGRITRLRLVVRRCDARILRGSARPRYEHLCQQNP
jgi:hypothetical protein